MDIVVEVFLMLHFEQLAEIHLQLVTVYGEEAMSWRSVAKWSLDLKSGQVGTVGNEKSGRLMTAHTPRTVMSSH
jgi:hypothetical protein